MCWGSDTSGQLGDNPASSSVALPAAVALSGRSALAIAAGALHTCAVLDTGAGVCWGSDTNGRLGDGGADTSTGVPSSTAALSIGSMTTRVGDLSLEIDGVPTTAAPGGSIDAVVRIGNAGPDAATGVRVTLTPMLLQLVSANAGQGTLSGLVWDVGTVSAGGQALVFLKMSAPTPGTGSLRAEVTASDVVDPDSKPNNGVGTEDDQAEVAITVPAPAVTPPSPATPTALTLTKFSLSKKTFRAEGLKGTRTVGTQIRFSLSTDATVTVTIERKVAKKFKKAGSFSFKAKAGQVRRTFTGAFRKKPLAKGTYRMRIRAVAGTTTKIAGPIIFTIATA